MIARGYRAEFRVLPERNDAMLVIGNGHQEAAGTGSVEIIKGDCRLFQEGEVMLIVLIVFLPGSVDLLDGVRIASQNRLLVAVGERVAANLEFLLVGLQLINCLGTGMNVGCVGSKGQS